MDIQQQIEGLVAQGKKIQAIKLYRKTYGVGLAEAKAAVEGLAPNTGLASGVDWSPELRSTVESLLRQGQYTQAIRLFRVKTGAPLKQSKEAVQAVAAEAGIAVKSGCFIATAAFGAPDAAEVESLRQYRDRVLQHSAAGRLFIRGYEHLSPPLARILDRTPWGKSMVRACLRPLSRAVGTRFRD